MRAHRPELTLVLATVAVFFLFGLSATIDTGIMNNYIHTVCARVFFILMILSQFYNTWVCWLVYRHAKKGEVSGCSLLLKMVLCGLYAAQVWLGTMHR